MMKLVNRLLIIAVIAFGAWFLIQHWDSAELPAIEDDGGEVIFEPVEGEDELVLDLDSNLSLEEQLEALRVKSTTTLTPAKRAIENGGVTAPEIITETEKDVAKSENSVVKVYLFEGGMDMSISAVPEGNVTFLVRNDGRVSHDFSVEGIQDFGRIVPGSVHTFELNLTEGEYVLFSPRELDQRLEMRETLRVEKAE